MIGYLQSSLLVAALILVSTPVGARSPLVSEVEGVATGYHEDPARLDRLYTSLTEAVRSDPDTANLVSLSRIAFVWGDIRAKSFEQKIEAYHRGREAGRRAIDAEPRNVFAHLWYAINTARWGQTMGIIRSLFLLSTLREEIRTLLDLAPEIATVHALAGNVDSEVPRLLGGSIVRAEAAFRTGLGLDPHFTGIRVGLAKVLIRTGRTAEARGELLAVLDERAPSNLADWTSKDVPEARRLLISIRDR